jgi:lipopolysaccharide assembly outer membrane protein LptD (OstA)
VNKRSRRCHHPRLAITISGLIALLWQHQPAAAESDWSQCGGALQLPPRPIFAARSEDPEAIDVSGDVANVQEGGISILSGNVEMQRGTRQLTADHLEYNEAEELIDVQGNVEVWDEGAYAASERAHLNLRTETTQLTGASYIFLDTHSHGEAGIPTRARGSSMRRSSSWISARRWAPPATCGSSSAGFRSSGRPTRLFR